ncbi:MAG: ABC transporter ATP-binding protein [Leptospiraceae bacterium]|nr:ABC transporter ATP-binding protein [Leptospiraceae bacterium]
MKLVQIIDLFKSFQQGELQIQALRGLSMDMEEGEFSALVGPSGSGKTTLMNCLGALDRPDRGSIQVGIQRLGELKQNELSDFRLHQIGFVFQAYNLLPVLTALENVEYVLILQGVQKKERMQRAKQILSDVGLADLGDRFPRQLSGGQQQRVAVARALVSRPRIVLADEPTANLDSENTGRLLDIMEEMCDRYQTAFLFSTHDDRVVQRARRVILLKDGQVQ